MKSQAPRSPAKARINGIVRCHRTGFPNRGWTTSNLEYQLVVNAFVYIDDDGEPMVGTVTCSSNQSEVDAEKELLAGLQKNGYVNYLRALTPL